MALAAIKGEMTLAQLAELLTFTRTRLRSGRRSFKNPPRSYEEMHPGVVGCGVRLPLRTSSAFLGLCVSAPAARLSYKAITAYVPLLRKFAQDIANVVDQRVALL